MLNVNVMGVIHGVAPLLTRDARHVAQSIAEICRRRGVPDWYGRFEFETLSVHGHQLHLNVLTHPAPKGQIIFTPGTNAYSLLYGENLTALHDLGYSVVGYDPRCHGQSTGKNGSYTVPELVDDLWALAHAFDRRLGLPLYLSRSSQGGIVSFYTAALEEVRADAEGRPSIIQGMICHNIAEAGRQAQGEANLRMAVGFPPLGFIPKSPQQRGGKRRPVGPKSNSVA